MNRIQVLTAMTVLVAGCGGGDAPPPSVTTMKPAMQNQPSLDGTVSGLDGRAMADVEVRLCTADQKCTVTKSDATGAFAFFSLESRYYALSASRPPDDTGEYAPIAVPVYVISDAAPFHSHLVLPHITPGTDLTGGVQTISINGALTMTVDGASMTFPDKAPHRISGIRIPPAQFPDFCVPSPMGRVLAMWAFAPSGAHSDKPIRIHLDDTLGLPPDSNVFVWKIDPVAGRPQQAGGGQVNKAATAIETGAGLFDDLHDLTWLLIETPGSSGP